MSFVRQPGLPQVDIDLVSQEDALDTFVHRICNNLIEQEFQVTKNMLSRSLRSRELNIVNDDGILTIEYLKSKLKYDIQRKTLVFDGNLVCSKQAEAFCQSLVSAMIDGEAVMFLQGFAYSANKEKIQKSSLTDFC